VSNQQRYARLLQQKLSENTDSIRQQWFHPEGTRTRHFVVDNLLPGEICDQIFDAFPRDASGFHSLDSFRERKRTSVNLENYDPILADITYAIQEKAMVELVSSIVSLTRIEPDPLLYAGGLSMMFKGDFLNPHIDNSHDADRHRYRRLNLLYYVSPDWTLESGGNFELWDETRTIQKTLISQRNRLIVMETNKSSWHSVSPVKEDRPRCCVSNYYFSDISPDATDYFHVTSFSGRPEERVKRAVGVVDNALRSVVSKTLKVSRGKSRDKKA
jgi:Rps23 Pro-64 3,4-dihydroxylase Tpa1-like proline 4-hydroxylase